MSLMLKLPRRYCRTLRSFRRIAFKDHGPCNMCHRDIKAGDEYECIIEVSDRRFRVTKWHVFCPEDFWEEEEEEHRRLDEYYEAQRAVAELSAAA